MPFTYSSVKVWLNSQQAISPGEFRNPDTLLKSSFLKGLESYYKYVAIALPISRFMREIVMW